MKHLKKFNENYLSMQFQNDKKLQITGEIKSTLISIFKEIGIPSYDELQSTISEKKDNIQSLIDDYNYQLPERFEIKMEELRYYERVYSFLRNHEKFKPSKIDYPEKILNENDMKIYFNMSRIEYAALDDETKDKLMEIYDDLKSSIYSQYYCEISPFIVSKMKIPINYNGFYQFYPEKIDYSHIFNILDSFVFYKINRNSFEIISSNFSDVLDIKGFNSDKTTFSRYIYDVLRPLEKLNITMSSSSDSKTIMIYLYNKSEFLDELKRNRYLK